jgi:hypothetical protein
MANFVRTTGGLLQLQDKQVSRADFQRIVQFARTVGDASVRSRVEQQNPVQETQNPVRETSPLRPTVQVASVRKGEPIDLQAVIPTVFR